jgi:transcriptional regulator with XRE-family HTH domain
MKLPALKYVRQLRGLTQPELADASGVSMRTIVNEEHGGEARPSTARKLAEALDVSIAVLAGVEPFPTLRPLAPATPEVPALQLEEMYVADVATRRRALEAATVKDRERYAASIERVITDVLASTQSEGDWAEIAADKSKSEGERRAAREQLERLWKHIKLLGDLRVEAVGEDEGPPPREERAEFIAPYAGAA